MATSPTLTAAHRTGRQLTDLYRTLLTPSMMMLGIFLLATVLVTISLFLKPGGVKRLTFLAHLGKMTAAVVAP